jgi:mannose-6-phosphate isomerase class I
LQKPESQAQSLLDGDVEAAIRRASKPLVPLRNNFVERPWGGVGIRHYKGLCALPDQVSIGGAGLGEAFEIAAYEADEEARAHPSKLRLEDGSELSLPALLEAHPSIVLGEDFRGRFGASFPLLPKTLDIRELLSVQGHPPGHTEAYVILDAEPEATLRLGFRADIDSERFAQELIGGLQAQQRLLERLDPAADGHLLHALLNPWFRERSSTHPDLLQDELAPLLRRPGEWSGVRSILLELKSLYWRVLDAMNAITVHPGQVIYNANPARISAASRAEPSAEVHALGNPEGREILLLEIRRPGPTFRAWDNVRFPMRRVEVEAAVESLNMRATDPSEFIVEPRAVPGAPGIRCSVDSAYFRVEHLCPTPERPVDVGADAPHSIHAVRGDVRMLGADGRLLGSLSRGDSALVPAGVRFYRVSSSSEQAEVIKASLPGEA